MIRTSKVYDAKGGIYLRRVSPASHPSLVLPAFALHLKTHRTQCAGRPHVTFDRSFTWVIIVAFHLWRHYSGVDNGLITVNQQTVMKRFVNRKRLEPEMAIDHYFYYSLAGVFRWMFMQHWSRVEVSTQVFNPWSMYVFLPSLKLAQRPFKSSKKKRSVHEISGL